MTDNEEEQEMEIEALQSILMNDMEEIDSSLSGLNTSARCFQITVSPMGDDEEEPTEIPVRMGLIFAHTPNYPEEVPLLLVRSLQGVKPADVAELQRRLSSEAAENVGMSMMYTLATSAKEWLREKYGNGPEEEEEDEAPKEEVIEAHGLPVTEKTFLEWRDRYEAESALQMAKLMSDTVLLASKEKKMSGRQWFVSGRHMQRGGIKSGIVEGEEEEEEEEEEEDLEEFDDEEDVDEDDMVDQYLADRGVQQT